MEIIRINANHFERVRDYIKELIVETMIYNFPNAIIGDDYYEGTLENVCRHLKDGSAIVFVAMDNGKVCGWIWCHPIQRFNERRVHIANFAVSKKIRNHGIGKQLIEQAEKYAIAENYDGLDLLVTKDNISAVSFYEKHGYETERYLLHKEITK